MLQGFYLDVAYVCVDIEKSLAANTGSKPGETAWSRSRALPGLRETHDRMVVT